ncbi:uncharacterized protein BKCO1_3400015 [Diplodia corticola]|uniref:Uncharacterized protein n=1 Tax=Diplodia corticola TaxID=236234 RepID=A0A1J9QYD5_9PEZI|nr:uncharacterized protein BKCO1_3400015 [Diplodia corticola]OJD33018.1 hypothetical protein BKCO1_3400015 [Diplodia corticola]
MLALFATHSIDRTFLPSTVLTIVSALVSFSYIILHSIVYRKHHRLQHGIVSRQLANACYVAIRLSVMLCICWLLTSGWNFIVAARQPICLPQSFSNDSDNRWRVGSSCIAERFSAAISFLALAASFTLFGILTVVRRPFEASLLGCSLSALTTNNDINHPQHQSRKLPHPEDGVYNPALRRAAEMSTSTLTSLTSSTFFRPETAMTERTTTTSILDGGFAGSTPGPSFPPSPSSGDAVVSVRQHSKHFNWAHSSPPPPLPLRFGTNGPPPLPPPPLLLPAAPIVSASTTTARRVSSAESRYTPQRPLTLPYQQQRSKSYGQSMPLLSSPSGSPSSSPARLVPARPARSPPPLDSAWRAVHPNPPGVTLVVGGGTTGYGGGRSVSPPDVASMPQGGLNVPKTRAKTRARPQSMPHHSPPQMTSWSTTTPTTSSGGWTAMAAVNEERGNGESVGSLALTTAALARLTAEQHAHRQAQQQHQQHAEWRRNGTVGGAVSGIARRGHGLPFSHRRIPTPSGPPPSMPISVRPVVDDGPTRTTAPVVCGAYSSSNSSSNNNNHNNPAPLTGRPATPINQMPPSAHHPHHAPNSALLSLLHHRAARQRPLRWTSRRSLSGDDANTNHNDHPNHPHPSSSSSQQSSSSSSSLANGRSHRRTSSCGTSSPLSTTMVRACEVDAEVLREETGAAGRRRREALGFGCGGGEGDEEVVRGEAGGWKGVDVGGGVEQEARGVLERSGRWCRVRRGVGVGGGRKQSDAVDSVVEGEGGDLGIEGRNWVRNASGEESVAGKSEEDDDGRGCGFGVERSGREDSGVQWEIMVTASSERGSTCGPSVPEPEVRPEDLLEPEQRKRGLLPSWGNGVVVPKKSPEQSFLEAVLAAGKVSPLLLQLQQQKQQQGAATCLEPASVSGDDGANRLARSATVVRRRAKSVEGTRQGDSKDSAGGCGGARITEQAMGVGLGLSCVVGVGSGAGQQGREAGLSGVKRAARTRRKTVVLG